MTVLQLCLVRDAVGDCLHVYLRVNEIVCRVDGILKTVRVGEQGAEFLDLNFDGDARVFLQTRLQTRAYFHFYVCRVVAAPESVQYL